MAATATKRATAFAKRIAGKLKGQLAAAKTRAAEGRPNRKSTTKTKVFPAGAPRKGEWVVQWQTLSMGSPAFWYYPTKPEADAAAARLKKNPGTGAFARCVREVEKKGSAVSPRGVCAAAGRKKYGKKKFQQMAAAGKRKKNSLRGKIKRALAPGGFMVLDGDGLPVHTGRDLPKAEALRIAKEARAAGEKGVHLVRSNCGPAGKFSKNPVTSIGQGSVRADIYSSRKTGEHQVRIRGQEPQTFKSKDAAMKYARLRVHELAQNPRGNQGLAAAESMVAGKQSMTSKLLARLKGKKNPEASAAEMYQVFHGLPAEKVIEYRQTEHVHEWLWAVGTLRNLHVSNGKKTITLGAPDPKANPFEDVVMVCMSEDGKQFHFRGGDQSLPLDEIAEAFDLNEDDVREHMEIGRVTQMTYQTRKNFEDAGKVNVDFFHDLGKEHAQNKLPLLEYKPLNPSMDLVGGRYKVGAFDKSIGASPGIIG